MTAFHGHLLAGKLDAPAALAAAKKQLRQKFPAPFHWAPFLFMGSP
jgi:CHAT domain-containing protein